MRSAVITLLRWCYVANDKTTLRETVMHAAARVTYAEFYTTRFAEYNAD